ncbi:MAG: NemA protein [Neisseria sp.]|nr:NemA protein [Neisseria sp.]
MKKATLAAVLSSAFLAACSVGTSGMSVNLGLGGMLGNHVGLGTSVNIPIKFDKIGTAGGSEQGETPVVGEQILTYFDAQGQTSDQAVKGGYLRKLISKRSSDAYVVQDFYDNGQKRTDPMEIAKSSLFVFNAHPQDGALTVYAYNGNVMKQQVYSNGKLVSAKY